MTTSVIAVPGEKVVVVTGKQSGVGVTVGTPGPPGAPGPPGPEGGTPVVAIPYANWPPVNPQPNTLYLRLAP